MSWQTCSPFEDRICFFSELSAKVECFYFRQFLSRTDSIFFTHEFFTKRLPASSFAIAFYFAADTILQISAPYKSKTDIISN